MKKQVKKKKKEVKVKEPLLPNQKKMINIIWILIGSLIVLGLTLSTMSWFDVF